MNKKAKIAMAAASVVMAGTMGLGIIGGCVDPEPEDTGYDVTINFDIGDNAMRSVSYAGAGIVSGSVKLPDGKTYSATALKPVWRGLQEKLQVNIEDVFSVTSKKIANATKPSTTQPLAERDIITDSVEEINTNSSKLLNLTEYLNQMPNFKNFIEKNDIVRLSLTSDLDTGAMYAAPYFDGYDTVEKYCLFKTNWVKSLLDANAGDTTTTWKSYITAKNNGGASLGNGESAVATSFMGTTGTWNTDVQDKDGNKLPGGVTISYAAVLTAMADTSAGIGKAYNDAVGSAYAGASGNIVDIQKAAIDATQGAITGAQLLKITQEYIKTAYRVSNTSTALYAQTGYKLSDVFVGNAAAWDVDLFAALGRVMMTNPSLLKSGSKGNSIGGEGATALKDLYLVAARQGNMQRMIDTTSLVGELYGIRGLEARNLYSYIKADGTLEDPREEAATYDAFKKFNELYSEGLVLAGGGSKDATITFHGDANGEAMMMHDYSNTQTPTGYQISGDIPDTTYDLEEGYYFTSIITPVSKWDVNADGQIATTEYFRFTESWRGVKNTGFAVPKTVADDAAKLAKVLEFIDFMFSEDGQIYMSYGPMAKNANGDGGFWYNPEAPAGTVEGASCTVDGKAYKGSFKYEGKIYASNDIYDGKYGPTVTEKVMNLYLGEAVNGVKVTGEGGWATGAACARSYTNFARYVIGSALPLGNKLQSFEYQMTSDMGKDGAAIVANAVVNDIIRHPYNALTNKYNNTWYTNVPTLLPYTEAEKTVNKQSENVADFSNGKPFTNHKDAKTNLFFEIIKNGYDLSKYNEAMCDNSGLGKTGTTSAAAIIEALGSKNLGPHIGAKKAAWARLYQSNQS